MTDLYLSKTDYAAIYPNFEIPEDEFDGLSQAAFDSLCALVENRLILSVFIPAWVTLRNTDADFKKKFQSIIGQQIQVLYHANGLQATTGGGDFGKLKTIDGIGYGQYAYNALVALLRGAGLMRRA